MSRGSELMHLSLSVASIRSTFTPRRYSVSMSVPNLRVTPCKLDQGAFWCRSEGSWLEGVSGFRNRSKSLSIRCLASEWNIELPLTGWEEMKRPFRLAETWPWFQVSSGHVICGWSELGTVTVHYLTCTNIITIRSSTSWHTAIVLFSHIELSDPSHLPSLSDIIVIIDVVQSVYHAHEVLFCASQLPTTL